jgi:hypothetical protein
VRPLRGIIKQYLSQYLAVLEWSHNLKKAKPEFLHMMIRPFPRKPT